MFFFFNETSLQVAKAADEAATKTLRVVAKCKPLAEKFVGIFGDWIKHQPGEVGQYAEMFQQVSYFRLVAR